MSVQRELDRKVSKLDRILQRILYMYLLGQLTSLMAKVQADRAFDEIFNDFMQWFRKEYKTPEKYSKEATRIMKILHEIKEDFDSVIEARTEEKETERRLKQRVWLIALGFIYSLHRAATVELAITLKVMIIWKAVLDSRTCETCRELDGTIYDPAKEKIPLRPHPSCRCWLELLVV